MIEEVGGPRISRFPICKSISLMSVQSFDISCVIILWVRRTALLIATSKVHKMVRIEKIAYIVLADKLPRPRVGLRVVR